jgi:hypothetical protein
MSTDRIARCYPRGHLSAQRKPRVQNCTPTKSSGVLLCWQDSAPSLLTELATRIPTDTHTVAWYEANSLLPLDRSSFPRSQHPPTPSRKRDTSIVRARWFADPEVQAVRHRRSFLGRMVVRVLVLAVLVMVVGVLKANAAPVPTWTNPCSTSFDPAVCERTTYLAEEISVVDAESQDTRQLVGWAVGGILVLMFAPIVFRLWSSRGL